MCFFVGYFVIFDFFEICFYLIYDLFVLFMNMVILDVDFILRFDFLGNNFLFIKFELLNVVGYIFEFFLKYSFMI